MTSPNVSIDVASLPLDELARRLLGPGPLTTARAERAPEGPDSLEALRVLRDRARASPTQAEAAWAALRQALRDRPEGTPQAWMLLAELARHAGHPLEALRGWHLASQRAGAGLGPAPLAALGLDTPERWSAQVSAMSDLRAQYLQDAYADIRRAHEPKALFRIDRALAGYLGKASVFSSHPTQRPKLMFIPGLRSGGFLDPASHPLVPRLLAAYPDLEREFHQALRQGDGLEPFMQVGPAERLDAYVSGPAGASWDALFFFRHGRRYHTHHARFPMTSALLDSLDLCRIDGQAPEVCFSILQPRTRIEPHHGVTNARVVIHIPFQVPPGCYLELTGVGRHHWKAGEPLVFDDTFEHSAENPADAPRGILLMDAWHPELTPPERAAFRALIEAITRMEAQPEL